MSESYQYQVHSTPRDLSRDCRISKSLILTASILTACIFYYLIFITLRPKVGTKLGSIYCSITVSCVIIINEHSPDHTNHRFHSPLNLPFGV